MKRHIYFNDLELRPEHQLEEYNIITFVNSTSWLGQKTWKMNQKLNVLKIPQLRNVKKENRCILKEWRKNASNVFC